MSDNSAQKINLKRILQTFPKNSILQYRNVFVPSQSFYYNGFNNLQTTIHYMLPPDLLGCRNSFLMGFINFDYDFLGFGPSLTFLAYEALKLMAIASSHQKYSPTFHLYLLFTCEKYCLISFFFLGNPPRFFDTLSRVNHRS